MTVFSTVVGRVPLSPRGTLFPCKWALKEVFKVFGRGAMLIKVRGESLPV